MTEYSEQYKQKAQNQQDMLETSLRDLATSVSQKTAVKTDLSEYSLADELNSILKFYRFASVDFSGVSDPIEHLSDKYNIECRGVVLKGEWYKNALGAYLAELDDGTPVALIPRRSHYYYVDPATRLWVKISKKNLGCIRPDALFFYIPLPDGKLTKRDLFSSIFSSMTIWDMLSAVGISIVVTITGMITPAVTRLVFSGIIPSNSYDLVSVVAVLLFGAALVSGLVSIVKRLRLHVIQVQASSSLHAAIMGRVLSMPASFFRRFSAGDLATRVNTAPKLAESIIDTIFSVGLTSLLSLIYIVQVVNFAPVLVIPALLILLAQVLVSLVVTFIKIQRNELQMKKDSELSGQVLNIINGMEKIRVTGQEKRVFAMWAKSYQPIAHLKYRPPRILLWYSAINTFIAAMGTAVLYFIAAQGDVSYANFLAFTSAYGMLSGGVLAAVGLVDAVANFRPMLSLLEPILETAPETEDGREIPGEISGQISLSNVSFRYQENAPFLLQNFSITIEPGQYVGICGTTGCGKSTLLRLMLGFETPESGEVSYDHYALSTVNMRVLRRQFGTVLQNAQLMQGSLLQNITVGLDGATEEDAWEAAEAAGIADDIRAMPMKMETLISYGGGGLSGGQKQRILIARALAGKPKVIFMDEATSALDNIAQAHVSQSMDALKCTRVVIAHRLSTIQNCDRILVLDKGRIVEDGTYEELIALNGRFASLVAKQRLDV